MTSSAQPSNEQSLDALIKVYEAQVLITQDTLGKLKELRDAREELKLYREREIRRLDVLKDSHGSCQSDSS